MRRCLFSGLVGCVVGRFLAADVQGKHGPCSPDLQRSDAPVLHAGLRAAGPRVEMALFGVLLGLLSRQAVSAIVTMAGGTLSPDTPSSWEARTKDPHRQEVLLQGDEVAFDELSQASGRTSASLLAHLVADNTRSPAWAARRRTTGRRRLAPTWGYVESEPCRCSGFRL